MNLYRLARLVQDIRSLRSPETAINRAANKIKGRLLARAGFWRFLWGSGRR